MTTDNQDSYSSLEVTFVMPVFNAGNYILEAVASITENTVDGLELEIIIVDDCSTDLITLKNLALLEEDSRIRVIYQALNGGPAKARNRGIMEATGTWISFLDADDILAPDIMRLRFEFIKDNPSAEWIAGDMLEMPVRNVLKHTNMYGYLNLIINSESHPYFHKIADATRSLINGFPPLFGSMMVRRHLFEKTGLLNDKLRYGEDFLFCWIASCYTDLYWINKPCFYLRRHHETSMTKNLLKGAREAYKADIVALRDPRLKSVRKELRWHISGILRTACSVYLQHGLSLEALKASLQAFYYSPNDTRNLHLVAGSVKSIFIRKKVV